MANILSELTIDRDGDDYILHIASEDGETAEFKATYAQLDLIGEALDEVLDDDEEAVLGVEGE